MEPGPSKRVRQEETAACASSTSEGNSDIAIRLLQLICICRCWPPPAYQGQLTHDRKFKHFCIVRKQREEEQMKLQETGVGTGQSMQEAKEAAAKIILDKLLLASKENSDITLDPITSLETMCLSRNWPAPSYEGVLAEQGSHTCSCIVTRQEEEEYLKLQETGVGTGQSAEEAKRVAASFIYEKLFVPSEYKSSLIPPNSLRALKESCKYLSWPAPVFRSGPTQERLFTFTCVVTRQAEAEYMKLQETGVGFGGSTQEAKEAAAKIILVKLLLPSEKNSDITLDPITSLETICLSRNWPAPSYEGGVAAGGLYSYTCIVIKQQKEEFLNHQDTGVGYGSSEQEAKNASAKVIIDKFVIC